VHSSVYAEDAIPGDHQECLFFDLPFMGEPTLELSMGEAVPESTAHADGRVARSKSTSFSSSVNSKKVY